MASYVSSLLNPVLKSHNNLKDKGKLEDGVIYPIHLLDQSSLVRTSITTYTFRYNQLLDVTKLRDSLVELLNMGDWRKLSGRLRQTEDGAFEIHVPKNFTHDDPAIRFSHVRYCTSIENNKLAAQIPESMDKAPSIHPGCRYFLEFSTPADLPEDINHYLNTNEPLICLHIVSFTDATLVSLTFPHALTDAMGTVDLLKAWSCVLAGSHDQVPQLMGARHDILGNVACPTDEKAKGKFILEDSLTTGLALVSFAARFLWDSFTRTNIESRHMLLTANFMAHLRRRAEESLFDSNINDKNHFMSDGDIITAWGASMVLKSRSWKQSSIIYNIFDVRGRLQGTFIPDASYQQNLIMPCVTRLTASESQSASYAQIALKVRESITTQITDMQIHRLVRLTRASLASTGSVPLFADSDSTLIACSNWTRGRFLEAADFRPAVVTDGAKSSQKSGLPVSYWGTTLAVKGKPRDVFVIYGKDMNNDFWVHAHLRHETWKLIEEEFNKFRLETGAQGA